MSRLQRAARSLGSPSLAAPASIALLALLASASSLVNGFVYDDRPIISKNPRVHTLRHWWELFAQPYWPPDWGDTNYRPLTILSFAAQWALGHGAPVVFHATSVALYVATSVAVLRLAGVLLPARAAWLVAALFAVHPVHVEAVGNVVGQAELVVALCSTLAVAAYIRLRTADHGRGGVGDAKPRARSLVAVVILYAVACLSKETGFFLPGLLLAAECTVVAARLEPARRPLRARARELWPLYATCGAIGIGYLALRYVILGGFGDDPNTVISLLGHKARLLTMLGVVPEWARLLLWPARLAADYSPADIQVITGFAPAVIPGLLILAGFVVLCLAGWSGKRVAPFGLVWMAVALFPVSNIFIRSGVIVAERTLFLPSLGAVLAVGAACAWAAARAPDIGRQSTGPAALLVALVLALGVARSATRQRVWRSSDDFLGTIVDDAPLGYRAHHMHGMWLFDKGRREEGERHVRMAIALFPYDGGPYTDLADQYRKAELCGPAHELYRRGIMLGPLRDRARLGLVACLLRDARFDEAVAEAQRGVSAGGREVGQFRRLLAIADSAASAQRLVRAGAATVGQAGKGKGTRP